MQLLPLLESQSTVIFSCSPELELFIDEKLSLLFLVHSCGRFSFLSISSTHTRTQACAKHCKVTLLSTLYPHFVLLTGPIYPYCTPLSVRTAGRGSSTNRIAEVVYDASIGLWGYLHLRKGTISKLAPFDTDY
jgi:hypothetical protein